LEAITLVSDIRNMFQENEVSGAGAEPQTKKAIKSANKPVPQRKTRKAKKSTKNKRKPKKA
jgi:hypothetical protein